MEDKEQGVESDLKGTDWEVVSLTASAYAAAPGPDTPQFKVDEGKCETSNVLFMSGHFVFPPNQHENLPLQQEENGSSDCVKDKGAKSDKHDWNVEKLTDSHDLNGNPFFDEKGSALAVSEADFAENMTFPGLIFARKEHKIYGCATMDSSKDDEDGGKSEAKDEHDWNIEKLTDSHDLNRNPFFDEKGSTLAISAADFAENMTFPGVNYARKEHKIYGSATMGSSNDDEDGALVESLESKIDSEIPNLSKHAEEDNHPYAFWLKKQAFALYANAKEANTFWSILLASAVMGLVILGQQWQQERWQVLHHKWQFGINDEVIRRSLVPISRFTNTIVGVNQRGFSIRANALRG